MDAPTAGLPGEDGPTGADTAAMKGFPTALVIDDSDLLRNLMSRILGVAGLVVTQARSVEEALSLDPTGHDILLVDVRLGGASGTDLVNVLQTVDPTVTGRCLMLSGAAAFDPLPAGVPVLAKPFTADDLLAAVRALLPASDLDGLTDVADDRS